MMDQGVQAVVTCATGMKTVLETLRVRIVFQRHVSKVVLDLVVLVENGPTAISNLASNH